MQQTTFESARDIMANIGAYLPTLFAGLIVLAVGGFVAWLASRVTVRVLLFLRLDRVAVHFGWGRALNKGDVRHSLFGAVGFVVGLFVFLVFLENTILIWKLTVLSELLERLVRFIPDLIVAGIILFIGWAAASAVSRSVLRALYQEEFEQARLVARLTRAAILVFTCAVALVQLSIAVTIVTGAFLIAFGALALACALAFGLGSKRAVEILWEKRLSREKEPTKEEESPAN